MNIPGKDVSLYKSNDNLVQVCLWVRFIYRNHWGQQGLGRVCLGVCPDVYLHLLYLVVVYIEHSLVFSCYGDWTLNNRWLKLGEDENDIVWNKGFKWKGTQGDGLG